MSAAAYAERIRHAGAVSRTFSGILDYVRTSLMVELFDAEEPADAPSLPAIHLYLTPGNFEELNQIENFRQGVYAWGMFAFAGDSAVRCRLRRGAPSVYGDVPGASRLIVRLSPNGTYPLETITLVRPSTKSASLETLAMHRVASGLGLLTTCVGYARVYLNRRPLGVFLVYAGPDEFRLRHHGRMPGDVYVPLRPDPAGEQDWEKRAVFNRYARGDYRLLRRLLDRAGMAFDRDEMPVMDLGRFADYVAIREVFGAWEETSDISWPAVYVDPTDGQAEPFLFQEPAGTRFGARSPLVAAESLPWAPLADPEFRHMVVRRIRTLIEPETSAARYEDLIRAEAARLRPWLAADGGRLGHDGRRYGPYTIREFDEAVDRLLEDWRDHRTGLLAFARDEAARRTPADQLPGRVTTWSGTVTLKHTFVVPRGDTLIIRPGTRVLLDSGVSLIAYGRVRAEGTPGAPVAFGPRHPALAWGSLVFQGAGASGSTLHHVRIEGGSEAEWDGVHYSGTVSIYNADVSIANSHFARNRVADDLVNIKNATARIVGSVFEDAHMDALDLDMTGGLVSGNVVRRTGNDGFDMMGSTVIVEGNRLESIGDKAFSVGEASEPIIRNNQVSSAVIGVASKDGSYPLVEGNEFRGCGTGVAVYPKNWRYPAPAGGRFLGNTFEGCRTVCEVEKGSRDRMTWSDEPSVRRAGDTMSGSP